jgi:hypothetical protein
VPWPTSATRPWPACRTATSASWKWPADGAGAAGLHVRRTHRRHEPRRGAGDPDLIRALKKDKTKIILLVEHKMDVVRELADRIIVLHNGTLVADGDRPR